jgi:hypothetical protein
VRGRLILLVGVFVLAGCTMTAPNVSQVTAATTPGETAPTTPPATSATPSAHSWVLAHKGEFTAMGNDLGTAVSDLGEFAKSPDAQSLANLTAGCSALGAVTIGAVSWTVPPGTARNDLLVVITDNTEFVHDCNALTGNFSSLGAAENLLESLLHYEEHVQTAFGNFSKALA